MITHCSHFPVPECPPPLTLFTVPLPKLHVPPTLFIRYTYPYHVPWPYPPSIPTMSPDPIYTLCLPCPMMRLYLILFTLSPDLIYPLYLYHVPRLYLSPTPGMSPDPIYHLPLSRPLILFTPYLPPCTSLDPVPFRHNNLKESVGGKPCSQEYARCNHHMRVWINLPASGACNDQ